MKTDTDTRWMHRAVDERTRWLMRSRNNVAAGG